MQRTSEKRHASTDRLSAGKAGDRLVHDCLKNRCRKIRFGCPFIDQGLNICFRKYAAACCDRVDLLVLLSLSVQSGGIRLQQRCHLIDERAGSAGADPVHSLL